MTIWELRLGQTHLAHAAMAQLRPAFSDLEKFVTRVDRVQRGEGYRLFGSFDEEADDEQAAGAAGFRRVNNLAWGDVLYVDDLSTREEHRRSGHGRRLLEAVEAEARRLGCDAVHLDSGHQRHDAHRLYLAQGYRISSHHFTNPLD